MMFEPVTTSSRLRYVTDRLAPVSERRSSHFVGRAFYGASKILDMPTDRVWGICGSVRRRKSLEAYLEFRNKPPAFPPFEDGPIDPTLIGNVYFARVVSHPHIIKIGISKDLKRRMSQLKSETGEEHEVFASFEGTLVDECCAQFAMERNWIVREWFFDPQYEDRTPPKWLPKGFAEILKIMELA